jgi:drug/metabolite transporter (DMT)-like permease
MLSETGSRDATAGRVRHYRGVALVCLATVAWASGGLFTRLLPYDMWTIIFWRGVFGTLFIGGYTLWRFGGGLADVIRAMGPPAILITLCSTTAITIFVPAFQMTSVANAFTIYASVPFLTAAVAWLWLRERPSGRTMIASAAALVGIVVMLGPGSGGARLGDLYAGIATLAMAVMTVAIRRSRNVEMLPVACFSTILSALIALPLAQHLGDLTARDYVVAAGFGLGPMTLGMMLYVMGSALIPATLSVLINTMEAPIGALWAWIGVGEVPAVTTLIGGAIVLGSVFARLLLERRDEIAHESSEI